MLREPRLPCVPLSPLWLSSASEAPPLLGTVKLELVDDILEEEGAPMGNLDLMIAAHALAVGTVLVTHDRVFRQMRGLKVEDWTRNV